MQANELLAGAFFRAQPEAAARLLESMTLMDARAVIANLPAMDSAPVLQRMLPTNAARCIEPLPLSQTIELMRCLPSQAGASLLRHLGDSNWRSIVDQLGGTRATALRLLLRYPPTAIGAWMEPNALTLAHDLIVQDARSRIATAEGHSARIYLLDRERKVRGITDGLTLLRGDNAGQLVSIAGKASPLWAREPLRAASDAALWGRETELPVVNRQDEFVGVISQSAVIRGLGELVQADNPDEGGSEAQELIDAFIGGLQGAWQSLSGALESERDAQTGRRT